MLASLPKKLHSLATLTSITSILPELWLASFPFMHGIDVWKVIIILDGGKGRESKELSSRQPPSNPKCIFQPFIKMFIIAKSFSKCFSRLPSMHDQIREKLQVFSLHSTQHKYCHGAGRGRWRREIGKDTDVFYWIIRFSDCAFEKGSIECTSERMNPARAKVAFNPGISAALHRRRRLLRGDVVRYCKKHM